MPSAVSDFLSKLAANPALGFASSFLDLAVWTVPASATDTSLLAPHALCGTRFPSFVGGDIAARMISGTLLHTPFECHMKTYALFGFSLFTSKL